MSLFSLFIFAAEIPLGSIPCTSEDERMRQLALLKLFFADISPKGRGVLMRDVQENYLQWTGIFCEYGLVDSVIYSNHAMGNFNIHALPHSTTDICIPCCQQRYSVQTRMLPRKLKSLAIQLNEIFGTMDLTSLPDTLTSMLAFHNKMCGPIDITNLPKGLLTLDISSNQIDQKVVVYGTMPSKIKDILLRGQKNVKNGIKGVRPISEDKKLSDDKAARIFGVVDHLQPLGRK